MGLLALRWRWHLGVFLVPALAVSEPCVGSGMAKAQASDISMAQLQTDGLTNSRFCDELLICFLQMTCGLPCEVNAEFTVPTVPTYLCSTFPHLGLQVRHNERGGRVQGSGILQLHTQCSALGVRICIP